MKSFTVTLPPDMVAWLRERADAEHRSVSQQLCVILLEAAARETRGKAARKPAQAPKPAPLLKAIEDAKAAS